MCVQQYCIVQQRSKCHINSTVSDVELFILLLYLHAPENDANQQTAITAPLVGLRWQGTTETGWRTSALNWAQRGLPGGFRGKTYMNPWKIDSSSSRSCLSLPNMWMSTTLVSEIQAQPAEVIPRSWAAKPIVRVVSSHRTSEHPTGAKIGPVEKKKRH